MRVAQGVGGGRSAQHQATDVLPWHVHMPMHWRRVTCLIYAVTIYSCLMECLERTCTSLWTLGAIVTCMLPSCPAGTRIWA